MPRFFFTVDDGSIPDPEGVELANLSIAKCEAVSRAGRMLCDTAKSFWERKEFQMTVTNPAGLILFVLNFIGTEAPVAQAAHS